MKYKIIFSDFDGTISKSDNTVTDNVKAKIASYRAAGGKFVLATGRLFSSILPRIKELGIDSGEAIVYQGGGVYDIATGKPIYLNVIEKELAVNIIKEIESLDYCVPIAYFADRCNCKEVNDAIKMFCGI
ncbi:MAG: Cof-type HAD-IIB family hydrolase, partial [Clostridia bacterium]|nr:Cof-type HAD-IIB family hydrolase [Clostridia bacterium]